MLIEGIIILVIGIILFAIESVIPPEARRFTRIIAIILVIVGAILILLGALGYAFLTGGLLLPQLIGG
jgi:TRAP-type C4-dicarboxylate transport system permease small subunit